jgi:hypothetical protein
MKVSRRGVADLLLSLLFLYASFWIYELSNYAAFSIVGLSATISLAGALPSGVASVSSAGQQLMLVKPIQVGLSCGAAGSIYYVARRSGATISSLAAAVSLSVFAASFYWEFLSLVGPLPLALHEGVYALLTLGGLAVMLRADPRLKGLVW